MRKIVLSVDGMTFSACYNGLEKYLNKQNGIESASVNLVMSSATINYDEKSLNLEDIERFIKEAGFKSLGKYKLNVDEKQHAKEKVKLYLIIIFSLSCIALSMLAMSNDTVQNIASTYYKGFVLLLFILASIVIILSRDILKNGIKNLIHFTPNMDTLVTIGDCTSYIYSIYMMIRVLIKNDVSDLMHDLYFETTTMILFFVKVGKYIENINTHKTKDAIKKLVTITPKKATIVQNDEEKDVTIDEVKKGDLLICRPGEKISVDGEIVDGQTHIDESFITGESKPAKKTIGMKVVAGSINYDGTIKYKAEKIGKESTVSEIVQMVSEASNSKIPIGRLADKICGVFVPIVITISIITLICWLIISGDIGTSINYFVSVLVVACPCSLGLATPLAIVVASGIASEKGILIKNSSVIENAHKTKNAFFDKTGTLTNGKLRVNKLINYSKENDLDVLKYVASIEKKSEHPIAKALVEYAKENKALIIACKDFKVIPGMGVYARIDNDEFYLGNKKLVDNYVKNINDNLDKDSTCLSQAGNSIIFVIKNNEVISLIGVKDSVRDISKELITKLNKNNVKSIMLTRR